MTVKEAAAHYGLASPDALKNRIRRAKTKGIIPEDTPHGVNATFTESTAAALGLISSSEQPIQDQADDRLPRPLLEAPPVPTHPTKVVERPTDDRPKKQTKKAKPSVRSLAEKLTSDPVVLAVVLVLLGADSICFGTISNNAFPDWGWVAVVIYAVIGFAVGVASIISYVRIKKNPNYWKWGFAAFQFLVFLSAKFAWWNMGKVLTAIGITVSFAGVITSLRDKK